MAEHLAFLGSIKDEIMDTETLAVSLLNYLRQVKPQALTERYKKVTADVPKDELLEAVCESRGFLLKGGAFDTDRAASIVLDEFRAGKIARISLEQPGKDA